MHIGEFSDTFYPIVDGVGRVVYNYASIIPRKGHECYVVAPMADTGYRGGFPFELVDFSARNVPLQKQYQTGIPFFDAHYGARIAMVPLDIVHAHSPFIAGQEALRLARKRDIPLVGHVPFQVLRRLLQDRPAGAAGRYRREVRRILL